MPVDLAFDVDFKSCVRYCQDPAKEGDKNDQEKDLRDQEEALRKQFKQESKRLFGQGEAANTNSTNRLNIVSLPVNAVSSSCTTIDPGRERAQRNEFESMFGQDKDVNGNKMYTLVSAARSTYVNLGGSIPVNATTLSNADLPTDPLMPDLEDTADLKDTRTFSGAYDDEVELDVRSAFLYGIMEEEEYVYQPPSFKDPYFPDKRDDGIFISQDKYVADILKKFDFSSVKTTSTLIETNKALLKDEEAEDVDVHLYKSMIGSLLYLTASRPNIIFAVCACARFQFTPKISHLHDVKRIFSYLKGQPKLGLWYPRDFPFDLEAFSDSNYAGASLDRKSTTGVDGKIKVVTEASVRRHLKLEDSDGISILPTTEIFEQLTLMGQSSSFGERLEANKESYGAAYTKLIMKVKKLEKTVKTSQVRRKAKIVVSVKEVDFENPSKKGRSMIEEINQDAEVTLVTPTQVSTQREAHSQEDQPEDTARRNVQTYTRRRAVKTSSGRVNNASRMISTTEESISTAGASMPISTAGMVDKGKGIMEESESDVTKTKRQQEQERLGLKTAVRLQEQFDEEERQRMARVHEAVQTFTEEEWENIRGRVKSDEELTQRLQAGERNKYNEVDQAKVVVDLINQRKRYFAEQKAKAKRKNPMTQAQQRNYMYNYIKHIGSYTLKQLKKLSFDEIKELFEATMRSIKDFVLMESEDDKAVLKLAEARSSKRDAEQELDQGRSKK
nr:uncharacterized mitochondrial protein AtMg00810-like [Tanacetum cinerariifolium]